MSEICLAKGVKSVICTTICLLSPYATAECDFILHGTVQENTFPAHIEKILRQLTDSESVHSFILKVLVFFTGFPESTTCLLYKLAFMVDCCVFTQAYLKQHLMSAND